MRRCTLTDRERHARSRMSAIVLGAFFALAVLVMALAGSHFARRTLMLMVAMLAIVLLAVWFFL